MKTQKSSSYVALLFLETRCYMRGVLLSPRPGRFTPQERDPVPILLEAGWASVPARTAAENFAPTGIRSMETAQPVASRYTDTELPRPKTL